ncbi:hypothetical protein LUZ60_010377 [Juncus effusus]|nr:hypothetical protein LUZ60_010377 [Juncus effusus]
MAMANQQKHDQYPYIIAMKGHPGTGKSTLAEALSTSLHIPLLDKDDIRDCTLPLQPLLPSASSQSLLNDLSYSTLFSIACTQIKLNISVIIDSPLSNRSRLDELVKMGAERVIVVECKPRDEEEWKRRLEERGRLTKGTGHKPSTWEELSKLREGYNGCDEYEIGEGVQKITVDTTEVGVTTEMIVDKVLQFINTS